MSLRFVDVKLKYGGFVIEVRKAKLLRTRRTASEWFAVLRGY